MKEYIVERYEFFMTGFYFSWIAYVAIALVAVAWMQQMSESDPHRGSKRYYTILSIVAFGFIGIVLTIFLPSPELLSHLLRGGEVCIK